MLKFFNRLRNKRGFTLIEVVAVTAIMAIIAAIGGPSVTGFLKAGTINSNDNIARALFLASQNAITDLYNRGELQTYVKFNESKSFSDSDLNNGFAQYGVLTAKNKVPSKISTDDGDVENNPYIYYMMLNNNNESNQLYKLLAPYVSDKGILSKNICIEFNAKNGIVKSAFYSDKVATFEYGGDGDGDILKNRTTTDKIGYYGTKKTGALPQVGKPVKVALIDGKAGVGELNNTLYVEAYVPDDDETYTITLLTAEGSDGVALPSYTELTKDGKPFALTFRVNGTGRVSMADMSSAMKNFYTDINISEHVTGYNSPVYVSTTKYDPFGNGNREYVKVIWVLDTVVDARVTYKSLVSQMSRPVVIEARLTCDTTNEKDISMQQSSHFDSQSGFGSDVKQRFFVSTARHLNNVRLKLDGTFSQIGDISIQSYNNSPVNFSPIGNSSTPFTGAYTGVNTSGGSFGRYKIANLIINEDNLEHVGLFGVNDGTIERVEITQPYVNSKTNKTGASGVVAGKNTGAIKQVNVISSTLNAVQGNVGTVAGINDGGGRATADKPNGTKQEYGVIAYCSALGQDNLYSDVTSNSDNTGGIAGSNALKSVIKYSVASNVYVTGKASVAGIVGINNGQVHNVLYNYAQGLKAQTENFIVPIKGTTETTSGIIGNNMANGTVTRVLSTALTKGLDRLGNEVLYNPLVGTGISDLSAIRCYYLSGVGYNEYTGVKLGVPQMPVDLVATSFVRYYLGATDGYEAWINGPGNNDLKENYPYPLIAATMPVPTSWPLPESGATAMNIAYYEYYSSMAWNASPKRFTLRGSELFENEDYVKEEGYGIEFYDRDQGDYTLILSAVSGEYDQTTAKKTYDISFNSSINTWTVDGVPLGYDELINVTRIMNGVEVPYKLMIISDKMIDGLIDRSAGYTGPNLVKIQMTKKGDTVNIVDRKNPANGVYMQPLFGKGLYEFYDDRRANEGIQKEKMIVRSPQQMMNMNYLNDKLGSTPETDTAKRTNYVDFEQEMNITFSTVSGIKHVNIDAINNHINKTGGVVSLIDFNGTYNGNNKAINNLNINTYDLNENVSVGLFSDVNYINAKIENVALSNATISSQMTNVGGIAGTFLGKMNYCNVSSSKIAGGYGVGGLIGESHTASVVNLSKVSGSQIGYHSDVPSTQIKNIRCVGGLIGVNYGHLDNGAIDRVTVRGLETAAPTNASGAIGGMIGTNHGKITNSTTKGENSVGEKKLENRTDNKVPNIGGAIGRNCGEIDGVTINGPIKIGGLESPNMTYNVGGIAGYNEGKISNSYVSSSNLLVRIEGYENIGGIVGYNTSGVREPSVIGHSGPNMVMGYVRIATSASSIGKQYIGGIVGRDEDGPAGINNIIQRCAVVGRKQYPLQIGTRDTGSAQSGNEYVRYVGGIAGTVEGIVKDCFFSSPATMNDASIKGVDKTGTNERAYVAGIIGNRDMDGWSKGNIDNVYFASAAPEDYDKHGDRNYYPLFSDDDKIPNGHAKTIRYLWIDGGLNDDTRYDMEVNNKKMKIDASTLRTLVGGNANQLPSTLWKSLGTAGYGYPVLISDDQRFENMMKTLENQDWHTGN